MECSCFVVSLLLPAETVTSPTISVYSNGDTDLLVADTSVIYLLTPLS